MFKYSVYLIKLNKMTYEYEINSELFEKKVLDICYDRYICRELGIDYCHIQNQDVERIRDYLRERYKIKEEKEGGRNDENI